MSLLRQIELLVAFVIVVVVPPKDRLNEYVYYLIGLCNYPTQNKYHPCMKKKTSA